MNDHLLPPPACQDSAVQGLGLTPHEDVRLWRQIKLLDDVQFELLKDMPKEHRFVFQAAVGTHEAFTALGIDYPEQGFDAVRHPWIGYVPFIAKERRIGDRIVYAMLFVKKDVAGATGLWENIAGVCMEEGDDLITYCLSIASLYPVRSMCARAVFCMPESDGSEDGGEDGCQALFRIKIRDWPPSPEQRDALIAAGLIAEGYAPDFERWLVHSKCLVTDLVRVAARRRELERIWTMPATMPVAEKPTASSSLTPAPKAEQPPSSGPSPKEKRPAEHTHSGDFRSVSWFGQSYVFTRSQAAVVKLLWEHWEKGAPIVDGQYLLTEAEIDQSRLSLVFRDHPAWNTMIVREGKSGYRLNPEPPQRAAKPVRAKPARPKTRPKTRSKRAQKRTQP